MSVMLPDHLHRVQSRVDSEAKRGKWVLTEDLANLSAADRTLVLSVGCFESFSPRCSIINNKVK